MIEDSLLKKQRFILIILLLFIILTTFISIRVGYSSLTYDRILPILIGQGTFKEEFILFSVRLPRILIILLAGMALALSGSILQSITRNDLADPGIIGINSGAGVAIAIFFLFFPDRCRVICLFTSVCRIYRCFDHSDIHLYFFLR